jgi:S1-C subfamily serine protease
MDEELTSTPSTANTKQWKARVQSFQNFGKRVLPLALSFVFAIIGVYLYNLLFPAPVPRSQNEINESIYQAMASATPEPTYSSRVYQIILPSLVYIQTEKEGNGKGNRYGVGSGVVINVQGDILTSLHVVEDADVIEIFFSDNSKSTAQVISADPENDIAVLRPHTPATIIVPAVLGNPGAMRVGDEAFAIGNPLGLTASMSAGVISGFDRSIAIDEDRGQRLEGLIQFDTAVNPGNSGGPLLNREGQVVGIVTALANPSEQNFFVGIGFAVPIGTAVAAAGGGPLY